MIMVAMGGDALLDLFPPEFPKKFKMPQNLGVVEPTAWGFFEFDAISALAEP
jgi:hypothetical protein